VLEVAGARADERGEKRCACENRGGALGKPWVRGTRETAEHRGVEVSAPTGAPTHASEDRGAPAEAAAFSTAPGALGGMRDKGRKQVEKNRVTQALPYTKGWSAHSISARQAQLGNKTRNTQHDFPVWRPLQHYYAHQL
jgi:hypothetical protein